MADVSGSVKGAQVAEEIIGLEKSIEELVATVNSLDDRLQSVLIPIPQRPTLKTSFTAKSTHHSAKPDYFYEMLDVLPDNPRIDMFARKKREGLFLKNKWDVWGNEVESDITL